MLRATCEGKRSFLCDNGWHAHFGQLEDSVERRSPVQERRKDNGSQPQLSEERRLKNRRKSRKLVGTPYAEQTRIDVSQEDELRFWCHELGVSADALRAAVQEAGPSLRAVREHLRKS
jgi:hypothetical protein